jgi:hypothetical protein
MASIHHGFSLVVHVWSSRGNEHAAQGRFGWYKHEEIAGQQVPEKCHHRNTKWSTTVKNENLKRLIKGKE